MVPEPTIPKVAAVGAGPKGLSLKRNRKEIVRPKETNDEAVKGAVTKVDEDEPPKRKVTANTNLNPIQSFIPSKPPEIQRQLEGQLKHELGLLS